MYGGTSPPASPAILVRAIQDETMADETTLGATDYVGAIQRNLSDLISYLQQPAMQVDMNMCRGHLMHIDGLFEKASERQAEAYARHAAANANGSGAEAAAPPPQ